MMTSNRVKCLFGYHDWITGEYLKQCICCDSIRRHMYPYTPRRPLQDWSEALEPHMFQDTLDRLNCSFCFNTKSDRDMHIMNFMRKKIREQG